MGPLSLSHCDTPEVKVYEIAISNFRIYVSVIQKAFTPDLGSLRNASRDATNKTSLQKSYMYVSASDSSWPCTSDSDQLYT